MCGGRTTSNVTFIQFCDFDSVQRDGKQVKFWSKEIELNDLESDKVIKNKVLIDSAAKIVASRYSPRIFTTSDFGSNSDTTNAHQQNVALYIFYEVAANKGNLKTATKTFVEMDCIKKMSRMLSVSTISKDGNLRSSSSPSDWMYVAPESNASNWFDLYCR
jgi:hypothetical protein